ncbi:MAG: hypothetical protein WCK65_06945 [Rhodospirillaceae bacterium]
MASLYSTIKEVFQAALRKDTFSSKDYEDQKTTLARGVAARFSRGSVAMQFGFVVTAEDLERERASLVNWRHSKPAT